MWWTRLGYYLKSFAKLPDYFSDDLGLPKADDLYGKAGLYALAEWHARHSSYRFNHLSAYQETILKLWEASLRRGGPIFSRIIVRLRRRDRSHPVLR